MTQLPRAMLIDMDDTILSAYGRPDIAWNNVTAEFASELAPLLPQQVAAAIVESGRKFWASAAAEWRLKLAEARHEVVRGGFSVLAPPRPTPPSGGLGRRLPRPLPGPPREEEVVFPGGPQAID